MISEFDRVKYKTLLKKSNIAQKDVPEKLREDYFIETELDTVKSWTRTTNPNKPSMDRLIAIADMCNCSIQDFFSDADKKREQIALEEIKSKPTKYSKSLQSTLSKDLNELLNYYQMLNEDDRHRYLNEIKQTAMKKLHGN